MGFIDLSLISLALALDAFGVGFSLGLDKRMNKRLSLFTIFSFGFFQFLFATLGGVFGRLFSTYIFRLNDRFSGLIIFFIGLLMIKDSFDEDEAIKSITFSMITVLGVFVSIDALFVGFSSLGNLNIYLILICTLFTGIVAFLLTGFAFFITRSFREIRYIERYSGFLSGLLLILFSFKVLFF